ncbi:MAG: aminotransferase class V-fold PLP-dependent enzyme [Desulfovibrionaceae bacterium]|jgi:selenocysteine lyase/cysteine desulfurase|nr:aminotransferase class V-fold PLP-dependent enzyme [Desulfovibrionaceae bacterium]
MADLDLAFVRGQFPAFSEAALQDTCFFENAGGSYMCRQVMERLESYYRRCKVQPYYPNPVSLRAGAMMDEAYGALAAWMNVGPDEIYFGPSTSQNACVLAQAALGWLRPGDEIVVTNQDHEANSGAWRRLERQGVAVREWRMDPETGELPVARLPELFSKQTRLLAFPHCSNILGERNPVAEICALAREHGVRTVVDGVSFAGHGLPDVRGLGADVYLFSLYKVYGPHQGVMVIAPDMAELLAGQGHFFNAGVREKRLTPAGPDHAQIAAVKGVGDYFEALYRHHFADSGTGDPGIGDAGTGDAGDAPAARKAEAVRDLLHRAEAPVLGALLDYLAAHARVRVVGPTDPERRSPTVSVRPEGKSPWELAERLGERGILCGAGHFYSVRLLEALGIDPAVGVLRFSLVHYTSREDVERLIAALDDVL